MPSDQSRMIEQAKFTYSLLGKAFEKQTKGIEDEGRQQVETFKILKPTGQQKPKSIEEIFSKSQ